MSKINKIYRKISKEKRKQNINDIYWGKPVSGFGDFNAKILILGLAPAAHGGTRTGRAFTGDKSGEFLFKCLYKAKIANKPLSVNLKDGFWFDHLVLMFQKEVANRIISKFNTSNYGRLSILVNWKLNVEKICDILPKSFSPKPKVDSSLLLFSPKSKTFNIKDPKNLEKVTRIFLVIEEKC